MQLWILIALLTPILHGLSNIIDNVLTNKLVKNTWSLVFLSSLFNLVFLPLIFFGGLPGPLSMRLFPYVFLIGLIEILYLYPYFKALQSDDTSIVSALFSLGKVFVPIFAYFLVDERLHIHQYAGFFIIILGSALLTMNGLGERRRFNSSLFYMTFCSILLTLESVIYKKIFILDDWITGFFWATILTFSFSIFLLFSKKVRSGLKNGLLSMKSIAAVFVINEFLTFGGSVSATLAISLAPVTLVKGITSLQPIFVLLYAIIFKKIHSSIFKEDLQKSAIIKKTLIFLMIMIGVLLISN